MIWLKECIKSLILRRKYNIKILIEHYELKECIIVPPISKTCANSFFDRSFVYAAPTLWNALDLDIRLLPFDTFKKRVKTHLYLKYFGNWLLLYLYYLYYISVSTMCIYCDYCVYHYKSTELVSLYTLDIGL